MFSSALSAMGGAAPQDPGPPNPAAMGVGAGAPPAFTGAPPPPTGIGAVPTGSPGTTKIAAASAAADALREAQGFFPELQPQINALLDAMKSAAAPKAAGKPGGPAAPGEPAPLGTPPPDPGAIDLSGAPGAM